MTPLPTAVSESADAFDMIEDPDMTPEAVALRHEVLRCLQAVLTQLSAVERAVIILRDIEDRSYQEIADTLKVGLSAAKMRIHRARLAFHQLFERLCSELWPAA